MPKRHLDPSTLPPPLLEVGKTYSGVVHSAKAWLLSGLWQSIQAPVFWIVKDLDRAWMTEKHLSFWKSVYGINGRIRVFPTFTETKLTTDTISPLYRDFLSSFFALREGEPGIYIFPVELFRQRLPGADTLEKEVAAFQKEMHISSTNVLETLVRLGYVAADETILPGTWRRRGDVIEMYPITMSAPVRLRFDGSIIESIESGGRPIDALRLLPLFATGRSSVDRFFTPQTVAVIDEPDELRAQYEILIGENESSWDDVATRLAVTRSIGFEMFPAAPSPFHVSMDFRAPTNYRGNMPLLRAELSELITSGMQIMIAEPEKDWSKKADLPHEHLTSLRASDEVRMDLFGFQSRSKNVSFLTPKELLGMEKVSRRHRTSKLDDSFLAELKPGDYVVHEDHGIARFRGMQQNTIDAVTREYYVLEYAQNDRLFVPVDSSEKLSKYLGGGDPAVHRLGAAGWQQTKLKIQKSTEAIAKELLQLYAKREAMKGFAMEKDDDRVRAFAAAFPFEETADQLKSTQEITEDLERDQPMDRLLAGDVGFGKTEVALRAAMKVIASGYQVAFLAPTTILVEQHYKNFIKRFDGFGVRVARLSRFVSSAEQKKVVAAVAAGDVDIIVGTHRLLSKDIAFKKLGIAIIDEEQRFGVQQKEKFKVMRANVHVLSMSATPIPRTLNLALGGLREMSVIETPPSGRLPIETFILPYREEVIRHALDVERARGGQIYVLHNRIQTIEAFAAKIQRLAPDMKIKIAHGQMDEEKLSDVMDAFFKKEADILVASAIIENGLDVPSVNTLIVNESTHLGLSQLYQLRGRVGRGSQKAFAYFFYHQKHLVGQARERLQALQETTELGSGFYVAMRDLEIRGAGNILGAEQSGSIQAIGVTLYMRLLHHAIEQLKLEQAESLGIVSKSRAGRASQGLLHTSPTLDVRVDIPLTALFPESWIPDQHERLRWYQELTMVRDLAEWDDLRKEMKRVLGPAPLPAQHLLEVVRLKLYASMAGCSYLHWERSPTTRIVFDFVSALNLDTIVQIQEQYPTFTVEGTVGYYPFVSSQNGWVTAVREILEIIAKAK